MVILSSSELKKYKERQNKYEDSWLVTDTGDKEPPSVEFVYFLTNHNSAVRGVLSSALKRDAHKSDSWTQEAEAFLSEKWLTSVDSSIDKAQDLFANTIDPKWLEVTEISEIAAKVQMDYRQRTFDFVTAVWQDILRSPESDRAKSFQDILEK